MFLLCVLLAQFALLAMLAWTDGQTIDEGTHLASGASYLTTGSYKLNPEHPPFVKLLAGSSALLTNPQMPLNDPSWPAEDQWNFGRAFLYHNTVSADTLLFLGRLPVIFLTLLLTLAGFLTSRVLLGARASWITLVFFFLEPTLLAHGHYVTTDVPFTLFFFLSIAYFWWAFHTRKALAAIIAGVFFALAQITKFSAIMLIPIFAITGLAAVFHATNRAAALKTFWHIILAMLGTTIIFVLFIYGFRAQTASSIPEVQKFYSGQSGVQVTDFPLGGMLDNTQGTVGSAIHWAAENIRIPAFAFFRGLENVAIHNHYGHTSYLLGGLSVRGWWYYFPVTLFVKLPAGILILAALGMCSGAIFLWRLRAPSAERSRWKRLLARYRSIPLPAIMFSLPPILYFIISLGSHINLGVRHMLPVYPFLFLLATLPFLLKGKRFSRAYHGTLWSILGLFIFSVGVSAPYFTSYFSEFVGGWPQGPRYVLDSNYDWGQDVKRLKEYLAATQLPEPISFSYFGSVDIPAYLGRGFARVPTDEDVQQNGIPRKGTIIISAGNYHSVDGPYLWLQYHPVTQIIGTSMYIFTFPGSGR